MQSAEKQTRATPGSSVGKDGLLRGKAHGSPQAAVVLIDVVPVVSPVYAEVQRGKVSARNAAVPGGKAVDHVSRNGVGGQIFRWRVGVKHGGSCSYEVKKKK